MVKEDIKKMVELVAKTKRACDDVQGFRTIVDVLAELYGSKSSDDNADYYDFIDFVMSLALFFSQETLRIKILNSKFNNIDDKDIPEC